jgi:hypothetical protein
MRSINISGVLYNAQALSESKGTVETSTLAGDNPASALTSPWIWNGVVALAGSLPGQGSRRGPLRLPPVDVDACVNPWYNQPVLIVIVLPAPEFPSVGTISGVIYCRNYMQSNGSYGDWCHLTEIGLTT